MSFSNLTFTYVNFYHMIQYLLCALRSANRISLVSCCFLSLLACKSPEVKPEAGTGNFTGYEMSSIPGSPTQYAVRKDAAAQIVIEGFITDNKRSGSWIEYHPDGEISTVENYVGGKREGVALKMASRGQVELKSKYHEGVLHGPWTQYKFGKVIEERNYNMGKLDGVVKTYEDRTWKLKQEVQYKNGLQDGFFRYYDENGKITLEYEYKNGEKLSGGIVKKD